MTASMGTLQNIEILLRIALLSGFSVRQISTSGWMPISRSLATLCWVGLVLSSPAAVM